VFYTQPANNLQFYLALNFQKDSNPQQTSFAGRYKRSATGVFNNKASMPFFTTRMKDKVRAWIATGPKHLASLLP
jgi:hypothetical protein